MSRSLSKSFRRHIHPDIRGHHLLFLRTFIDGVEFNFVRDRGLDHAVEKEKNLQPLMNLKNLIKSEPSKSIPLSTVVECKEKLSIPMRPIEFVRKYPSVFEEYFPGNIRIHPHVRLTEDVLQLDSEEQLIYQSDTFRRGAADRLLKLLMLCRVNEIPLGLIDKLKWDLGIPDDYVKTLVPEFPHYFQVRSMKESRQIGRSAQGFLELVCWDSELAVSAVEKKAMKGKSGYQKGMPLEFPLQFSNGFEVDKRLMKWIDDWQKLPYVSPYENASHLQPKSDESDRWAVGVLHEFLHILVSKKMERDNLLCLGDYLGIRSRFKRAFVQHPGIFYLSSKAGTYTVVLKEGFKRGLLIEQHALMEMRNRYIHLMNKGKGVEKPKTGLGLNKKKLKGPEKGPEVNGDVGSERVDMHSSDVESESDDEDYSEDEVKEKAPKAMAVAVVGRKRSDSRKNDRREPRRSDKREPRRRYVKRNSFPEAI